MYLNLRDVYLAGNTGTIMQYKYNSLYKNKDNVPNVHKDPRYDLDKVMIYACILFGWRQSRVSLIYVTEH